MNLINSLSISSGATGYKFDNFKIWQGVLDSSAVLSEYEAEKAE